LSGGRTSEEQEQREWRNRPPRAHALSQDLPSARSIGEPTSSGRIPDASLSFSRARPGRCVAGCGVSVHQSERGMRPACAVTRRLRAITARRRDSRKA
jgi:hypothetical protein